VLNQDTWEKIELNCLKRQLGSFFPFKLVQPTHEWDQLAYDLLALPPIEVKKAFQNEFYTQNEILEYHESPS
jgi:hypothetical protein